MSAAKVKVPFKGKMVDGTEVGFNAKSEPWAEYSLSDGAILRFRSVVTKVVRMDGEYDDQGNPIYFVNSQNIAVAEAVPDSFKKK